MQNPINKTIFITNPGYAQNEVPLAMAYVRRQEVLDLYPTADGYTLGTIFRELYKPFMPEMKK